MEGNWARQEEPGTGGRGASGKKGGARGRGTSLQPLRVARLPNAKVVARFLSPAPIL